MFMPSLIYQQRDCTTDLCQINGQLCSDMIGYDTLLAIPFLKTICLGSRFYGIMYNIELCKLRLFLLRLRLSKLRLRQGNFEEISYFKIETEEREFSNLFPPIDSVHLTFRLWFRTKCEISVSN